MIKENFSERKKENDIDVRGFILDNYTPFEGEPTFLTGATERTKRLTAKVNELFKKERENGGVLSVDTERVATITAFPAGYIDKDDEIIVGLQTDEPLKRAINPFGGMRMARQACEAYGYKVSDKIEDEFKYRTTHNEGVYKAYTKEMRTARKIHLITGLPDAYGRGRIIGDYRRVALYGVDYLIECKQNDKAKLEGVDFNEENTRKSEELSNQIEALKELKEMAESHGYDISSPAKTAREAIQWTYFAYLAAIKEQNGAAMSLGRTSTFFDIYIERDIQKGILNERSAQELIDDFVLKLRLARHLRTPEYNELFGGDPMWITESIGGMAKNGKTLVTKTSYRFLQTLYNLGAAPEPNLTVLWSKDLPESFKRFCAKVSVDTDAIQYENDDLMRKIYGDDYAIACCVSAMKIGKQMQFFGARCNLPKLLLLALNGGVDASSGLRLGPQMPVCGKKNGENDRAVCEKKTTCRAAVVGDNHGENASNEAGRGKENGENAFVSEEKIAGVSSKKLDYKEVKERLDVYLEYIAKLYVNTMNVIHFMHDKYAYEAVEMALHDTDIHRFMAFGIAGLSVLADSLSAIKYANVYPTYNSDGYITGFETEGEFPTYGNDDDRVDSIAKGLTQETIKNLRKTPAYRSAEHTLSVLTITSNVMYGKHTGATPDGRKDGEPFAPGANPMHNREKKGALASLNSVAKISYDDCRDGISDTFSITPDTLGRNEEERIDNLVSVLDGYFKKGAHHINVNVMTRETLIKAYENPEAYPNLTIRVSGYAVNFHKLSKEQQREVISRTFHEKL